MTNPERRHALVVGGTTGIGRAIADRLARDGLNVTVTGSTQASVAAARADGMRAERLQVADSAAIDALFAGLTRLDVLVNCAGINRRGGAEFDPDTFEEVVRVNQTGTMRTCLAAHPLLKASGDGAIVNIVSMFALFGSPLIPAYATTKTAILGLTRSLAVAWAGDGIRVNAIAPGYIRTGLTRPLIEDAERSRQIVGRTPMRRWGEPGELAGPAAFLCSGDAGFVTGAVLTVDGGYSAA